MNALMQPIELYAKNIEVMEKYFPSLAVCLRSHQDRMVLKIDLLKTGDYALFQQAKEGWVCFHARENFYYLQEILTEVNAYLEATHSKGNTGFVFYGLDAGLRLIHFFNNSRLYYPIFVVERYPEVLKAVFSYFDLAPLFESRRVFFFTGEDAGLRLSVFIREKDYSMLYPMYGGIFARGEDSGFYMDTARQVGAHIQTINDSLPELTEDIDRYYGQLGKDQLASEFSSPQLRILGALNKDTTVMQYVMKDCMAAFEAMGYSTRTIENEGVLLSTRYYLSGILADFKPHMWFKINHTFKENSPGTGSGNLVIVTWVQDYMLPLFDPTIKAQDKINRNDQLLVLTKHFIKDLGDIGFPKEKLNYFYFGANTDQYFPLELSEEEKNKYCSDVSFVGNYPRLDVAYSALSRNIADEIYRQMADEELYSPDDFMDFFASLEKKQGEIVLNDIVTGRPVDFTHKPAQEKRFFLLMYAWPALAAAAVRIPYLESIVDTGLSLYGRGWENDSRFKKNARGTARPGDEVCRIYNAAKINLNLHPTTNNHLRIFDIVASGGFLLTRWTTEDDEPDGLGSKFEVGREIEVFRSIPELQDKIAYYLSHDSQRQQIARRGRERLLREHTMQQRMQQVLDIVRRGLQENEVQAQENKA